MSKPQRQDEPHIGIVQLYYKIEDMQEEVSKVKQVLNNGIVKTTSDNTQAICNLSEDVEKLEKVLVKDEGFYSGKQKMRNILVTIAGSVATAITATLAVLEILGYLSIIGG